MRTENLRTNQLSDEAYSWYLNVYGSDRNEEGRASSVRLFSDTAPLFA